MNTTLPNGRAAPGITLVEVLVLICLLTVVALVFLTNQGAIIGGSKSSAAKLFVTHEIDTPLKSYKLDTGQYPTATQGYLALIAAPPGVSGWHGPYLKATSLPLDPWGHPYHYIYPAAYNPKDQYDCWSSGPDGISGTKDDIGNW